VGVGVNDGVALAVAETLVEGEGGMAAGVVVQAARTPADAAAATASAAALG
jgi:hypothetical protein